MAGLAVLVPVIIAGGVWLQVGLMVVIVMGMWEFYRAFGEIGIKHFVGLALAVVFIGLMRPAEHVSDWRPLIYLVVLAVVAWRAFGAMRKEGYRPHGGGTLATFGYFYIAVAMSTIFVLREGLAQGQFYIWLVFISAWGCDTGAYFVGRGMGRHKLAPILSPKKTVEGSIGGTVTATLLGAMYGLILYSLDLLGFGHVFIFAMTAFVCSIAGQIGDLAASAIKRGRRIKDFGNVMPGHGGVLDRFDSIIFVAPPAFVILAFVERLA
jgi:phosphatidate cytidylyltransferase